MVCTCHSHLPWRKEGFIIQLLGSQWTESPQLPACFRKYLGWRALRGPGAALTQSPEVFNDWSDNYKSTTPTPSQFMVSIRWTKAFIESESALFLLLCNLLFPSPTSSFSSRAVDPITTLAILSHTNPMLEFASPDLNLRQALFLNVISCCLTLP